MLSKIMDDSTPATTLGRYRLLRRIGRGGMGEVWLAEDPRLQRQVALKILPLRRRDDQEFLVRFEREARAAAALHHPHILPVHDYGQQQMPDDQTVTYLVMSYVSGGSVEDRLKAASRGERVITQDEALMYLFQVAEAIDYAHSHGIIHRDIKPANMLLREDNWLLLTDFGIARILTDADSSTKTGAYLGTPTYMAPEQAQGQAVPASDIYSLAIVTYQLFTGRVPFHADNPYALTFQHAFATAPAPHIYNPALPPEFEAALLRGMAKDPAQRPLTATAFVTSLQQGLQFQRRPTQPVGPARPIPMPQSTPAQPAPRSTRRNVLIGVGIGALLVGGGAAAYALSPLAHHGPTTLKSTPAAPHPAASATSSANAPLAITAAFNKPVTQMAWSPVKNVLLTVSRDAANLDNGLGKLWSMPVAGQSTAPTQLASHNFNSAGNSLLPAWSPDGSKIALANAGVDSALGAEVLFYTSDFSGLVSGLPEKTVSLPNQGNFCGLGWLSNTILATLEAVVGSKASNLTLKTWNIQHSPSSPVVTTINQEPGLGLISLTPPNGLAISPNGSAIAVVFTDGLQVGKIQTSGKQSTWKALSPVLQFQGNVGVLGWSADGRYLAAAGGPGSSASVLGLWDATQQYNAVQSAPDVSQLSSVPSCFAWGMGSQKNMLAIGGIGGQVGLWNVGGSATPQRILPGTIAGAVQSLAWSSDGQWLAASYNDAAASILIWRI
jgi:serine/threonine protein kinase